MIGATESAWNVQSRVVSALILRDMRTHHGHYVLGHFVIILKPMFKLLFMMAVFLILRGRTALVGHDPALFWGTGLLPYILCLHPAVGMSAAITRNRPLLYFPIVQCVDVIISRGIVEVITALWVTIVFCMILVFCGVNVVPLDMFDAVAAILATIYLGFGLGAIAAVLSGLFPFWPFVNGVILTGLYFTSGVFFVPAALPPELQYIVWFNPLLHAVEWLRSAYYEGYGYGILNRAYLFAYPTFLIFLAMLIERGTRGRLLQK